MPARFIRSLTRNIFLALTGLIAIVYLMACLIPFLNPSKWWIVGFLGLSFPYLLILLIFLLVFWLIAKPRFAIIPLLTMLIGYQQIKVLFARNIAYSFTEQKHSQHIRILNWNVRNFVALSENPDKIRHNKEEIAASIIKANADIVCLQEFNHSSTKGPQDNNIGLFSAAYPYHHFSRDLVKKNGFYEYGSIIFSRYPIIKKGKIKYAGKVAESLIYIDILKAADTIRIYTTHLQSFSFKDEDYQDIEKIQQQDDEAVSASKNIFKKMKRAFVRRGVQAKKVREQLQQSPHPYIICGDFNDVPNSFTYFHIRGNAKDAFLEKSFGIGRTYISLAPTLRIDYILPSKQFTVEQFEMIDEDLSDHIMLITDVSLTKANAAVK